MEPFIRKARKADVAGMKEVLDGIELFPSEMLDEMMTDYFDNPQSEEIWFVKETDGKAVALGFCAPEKLTEGTWNLYAIGIHKDRQGQGIGREMMAFIENLLRENGQRILVVDTSGSDAFAPVRRFYEGLNFTKEAVIRDFWSEGDDKVVFWKRLNV